ncbi:zinc-ribbon domain-containing protein, partial [Agrobacterium sp. a22-2]|nr:zinc-ribbon domain-containing protein [Agrobacterium sp. a22-2]
VNTGQVCPNCRTVNPPDARFCIQCGTPLSAITCRHCGAGIPPNAQFCSQCGQPQR